MVFGNRRVTPSAYLRWPRPAAGSVGLYYEWQTDGTTTWHKELVAEGN